MNKSHTHSSQPPGGADQRGSDHTSGDPQDRVSAHAQATQERVREVKENAKTGAHQTAEDAKEKVRDAGRDMREQAMQAAESAKRQGAEMVNGQKQRVASELHTYSEALGRAAVSLERDSDTNLSQYAAYASDELARLGDHIERRDLGGLYEDAEDVARDRPELFFGGMFVAGLGIARFMKASREKRYRDEAEHGYEDSAGEEDFRYEPAAGPASESRFAREGTQRSTSSASGAPRPSTASPNPAVAEPAVGRQEQGMTREEPVRPSEREEPASPAGPSIRPSPSAPTPAPTPDEETRQPPRRETDDDRSKPSTGGNL